MKNTLAVLALCAAPLLAQAGSYTKIANDGSALPDTAALGPGDGDWACTRDNATGLIWEVKTTSGLRSQDHTYTWFDSSGLGGMAYGGDTCFGAGAGAMLPRCDTEKYAEDVNAAGLCGATDWRMPALDELLGIVEPGYPRVNRDFFPNTPASATWSATPDADQPFVQLVYFWNGFSGRNLPMASASVRLVRAEGALAPMVTGLSVQDITHVSATVHATSNRAGTGWWLAWPAVVTKPPTPAEIRLYGQSMAMEANSPASHAISNLQRSTAYALYFVAYDTASGQFSAPVQKVAFTTATPVDGDCGSPHGVATLTPPLIDGSLCKAGTPGAFTSDASGWVWPCDGSNGGRPAWCRAPRGYIVTPSASGNGSIGPGMPRVVAVNTRASFDVLPEPGHGAAMGGTCGGSLAGGTYTTAPILGDCTVQARFEPFSYPIAASADPAEAGHVVCTPDPVQHGGGATCTATPATGYQFAAWTGACGGTGGAGGTCHLAGVTGLLTVGALFTLAPVDAACGTATNRPAALAPDADLCATGTPGSVLSANGRHTWECAGERGGAARQCSVPWASAGRGTGMVRVDGAGGWRVVSAAFDAAAVPALPPGARSAHAPLALVLEGGSGPAQVTVTYTEPAPQGAIYLKYGPSRNGLNCAGADCAQPHWYALPGAAFSADRTQVNLELADGGDGDADGAADGRITDPGLPALLAAPAGAQAIPALSGWALALTAALAGLLGWRHTRTQRVRSA